MMKRPWPSLLLMLLSQMTPTDVSVAGPETRIAIVIWAGVPQSIGRFRAARAAVLSLFQYTPSPPGPTIHFRVPGAKAWNSLRLAALMSNPPPPSLCGRTNRNPDASGCARSTDAPGGGLDGNDPLRVGSNRPAMG